MNDKKLSELERSIARKLEGADLEAPETTESDYDAALTRVRRRLVSLSVQVEKDRARVERRYRDLADQPSGRQATVVENSSPSFLVALAFRLMRESYENRFDDVKRSLKLSGLAHQAALSVAGTDYLSPGSTSDLIAETLDHLGNALRLKSDLSGANRAFREAEIRLESGTKDRTLRADHLSFVGSLRLTEGRAQAAGALQDQEIKLRRLTGDTRRLGVALMDRGLVACWIGERLAKAGRLIREGVELVEDRRLMYLGLINLAEAFARRGDGLKAWKLLRAGDPVARVQSPGASLARRQRWVKALVYRCVGEASRAEKLLTAVRDEFVENEETLRAGLVSLDLLAALATQGKHREVIPLADATYRILVAERLEGEALAVFALLRQAAAADRLTEKLAVRVANFVVLRQHNREARFD